MRVVDEHARAGAANGARPERATTVGGTLIRQPREPGSASPHSDAKSPINANHIVLGTFAQLPDLRRGLGDQLSGRPRAHSVCLARRGSEHLDDHHADKYHVVGDRW